MKEKVKDTKTRDLELAIAAVLETDPGRRLFKYLHDQCGFAQSSVLLNPATGEPAPHATIYNEARRSVYLHLRRLAKARALTHLRLIELPEPPAETESTENEQENHV